MPPLTRKFSGSLFIGVAAAVVLLSEVGRTEFPLNPAAAEAYSSRHGGTALMISSVGRPEFASFRSGIHRHSPVRVLSITKSLTALACLQLRGLALDQVVRPASEPVTLRHLLSQTSGLATGYEKLYQKNVLDVRRTAANLPQVSPPGKSFCYGPSHFELLGAVLSPDTAHPDRAREVLTKFLNHLGVSPVDWRTDRGGRIYLSTGAMLTPEDLLKIGRYVLKVRNRRVPSSKDGKIQAAWRGSAANPAYGLGFWLNNPGENARESDIETALATKSKQGNWNRMSLSNAAPQDLICMAGSGGQRVYILPSLGTVVVRLGRPSDFQDPLFLKALFSPKKPE